MNIRRKLGKCFCNIVSEQRSEIKTGKKGNEEMINRHTNLKRSMNGKMYNKEIKRLEIDRVKQTQYI